MPMKTTSGLAGPAVPTAPAAPTTPATPAGDQPQGRRDLPTVYDPASVEVRRYEEWVEAGYFRAEIVPGQEPFTIVIPPPNITGALHIGHALNNSLQDVLIRWRRMAGQPALWLPGTDHASIATHARIEKNLAEEGTSRFEIGREEFLRRAWAWYDKYGNTILNQLRRLGCSCDWSRQRFTLDEGLSRAVQDHFITLYEQGLIYRGDYIVNWCPGCRTVVSDIEVVHTDEDSHLWHVAYPLADGSGEIVVATTRPETMLGDTAVAVHPDDERYRDLVGKEAVLPVVGRMLPIIADTYVDPAFGSGAVKVTPAHDPNDYEIGRRHRLQQVTVIGEDMNMTPQAGKYAGMDRYECRSLLVEELESLGALRSVEPYRHSVGHCDRCDTVIEPLISRQWFVKMKPLAGPAIAVVRRGRVRILPERFEKIYLNWMENIRDWCISRQLWWGHRIPAWYCRQCGEVIVAREEPASCAACGGLLEQDQDVLDTWFSSALWPFSTLGWPDDTPDLRYFFPTTVLITAYEIIFFWVARMIFSSLHLTGDRPFRDVLIHGLVRDGEGRKMSKSLDNGVDPIEVIEKHGADALRFGLLTGTSLGGDVRFSWDKFESARNFVNKLWNAARFVLLNLDGPGQDAPAVAAGGGREGLPAADLELADRWILSRLARLTAQVSSMLERYDVGEAAKAMYDFAWGEFCDWYIELAKIRLYGDDPARRDAAQAVLVYVLERLLRLLHPVMPFVTEEIWQALPHDGPSIVVAPWPETLPHLENDRAEAEMGRVMDTIRAVRNIRAEMNVPAGKQADVTLQAAEPRVRELLSAASPYIRGLASVGGLQVEPTGGTRPKQAGAAILAGIEVYMPLRGLIDFEREAGRIRRALGEAELELARARERLANESFLRRAPADVVAREREKEAQYAEQAEKLRQRLTLLEEA
ncbi:MAG: valine--tRNA ligase [Bacillota bacterium]|nr:valine--tRNA ligase [Bacillota bacterium]